jgi:hypothetical protein
MCSAPIVVLQLQPLSTNTTVPYKEQQSGCALQVLAVRWIHLEEEYMLLPSPGA